MQTIKCVLCKDKQQLVTLYRENFDPKKLTAQTFSARRTPDRMHYRIVKCTRCGLLFSNPILEQEKISNLYKASDFTFSLEAEYLKKTYWNYLKDIIPQDTWDKIKLLEIGCSNGFFLEEVYRRGIKNVYGVEPGKSTVAKAPFWLRKRIKIDILKPRLFRSESFDIICCFHTLDHIIKPDTFVQETYKLLKKGGKAFFIVHNTSGLSVRLLGERSPIFDIEHIYLFNPTTLSKLFQLNNFKPRKIINIKNRYPFGYWFRLTPLPAILKNPLLVFLAYSKLGLIPLTISAGNIGIIAEK